ncbi:MAG: DsbC family protein [Pseudomonadota bacterium]|nr:MAG: thiol:disulfide interchange protein [Pseudomonadota bacterium]
MFRTLLVALFFVVLAVPASADEAAIKRAIEARLPGAKVESVTQTPYFGLYEVQIGNEILYTDGKAEYLFVGNIHKGENLENLTEARLRELNRVDFAKLPFDQAFKIVNGKGTRKLAYFSDPNCPYCKRMDKELTQVKDVTIYVFLYPILSQDSMTKSQAVWCSPDRAKAWLALMLENKAPTAQPDCDTPVLKNLQLGQKLRVRGTPALFFADGERVSGAVPAAQVEELLAKAAAKK